MIDVSKLDEDLKFHCDALGQVEVPAPYCEVCHSKVWQLSNRVDGETGATKPAVLEPIQVGAV
jgi:hypothetical protein